MTIIGIDLGTTNSLVAVWKDGRPQLVPNALGNNLTPSCVSIDGAGEVLVGTAARERASTSARHTVSAFKRWMGSDRFTRLGARSFRPEELSALVLKSLKADAEAWLGGAVTEAVITVPAYFNDSQRQATRVAGELAGLKVERLVNEPTAAALAYGLHEISNDKRFLIFDLGGGTFDISILEYFDGVMEVHASAGDNYLGGEDFLDVLLADVLRQADLKRDKLGQNQLAMIRNHCEAAKRRLSVEERVVLRFNVNDEDHEIEVTRAAFDASATELLNRLAKPCQRALRDAGLRLDEIDEVILVGGATRMPIISKLVAKMFGRLPLRHINPDEVVAVGAAVQAGLKARDAALRETVLTDVCPYTLGVEVGEKDESGNILHGLFDPIIERNITIPTSRAKVLQPLHDYQNELNLRVFQGESRLVEDNILLGELNIRLPRAKADEVPVEVRFTYDINGLLEVEATLLQTGVRHELLIEQNPGRMTPTEIRACLDRLAHLKVHPRDQEENRVLLERAKRLYEETTGDTRVHVGQLLDRFRLLLDQQNEEAIRHFRRDLAQALDQLDHVPVF